MFRHKATIGSSTVFGRPGICRALSACKPWEDPLFWTFRQSVLTNNNVSPNHDRKAALFGRPVYRTDTLDPYEHKHHSQGPARRRRPLRAPDQALEPAFEAFHLRPPPGG